MSARYVLNKTIRFVTAFLDESPAQSDVESTLRAVDDKFALFYYALAVDAGLSVDRAAARASAVLLQFASVQLADDLADGDCDYLKSPSRTGAGTQWLLQHLYNLAAIDLGVGVTVVAEASRDFVCAGAAQQVEIRTTAWDLSTARAMAVGLNARQHRAYFRLVLAQTPAEPAAAALGYDFGFALHVSGDRIKGDERWARLDASARQPLLAEARFAAARLLESEFASVRERAKWFEAVLARE